MEFKKIERPSHGDGRSSANSELYRVLAATAEDGGAIEVPLNGEGVSVLRSRLSSAARFRGLNLHLRVDKSAGVARAWTVKK